MSSSAATAQAPKIHVGSIGYCQLNARKGGTRTDETWVVEFKQESGTLCVVAPGSTPLDCEGSWYKEGQDRSNMYQVRTAREKIIVAITFHRLLLAYLSASLPKDEVPIEQSRFSERECTTTGAKLPGHILPSSRSRSLDGYRGDAAFARRADQVAKRKKLKADGGAPVDDPVRPSVKPGSGCQSGAQGQEWMSSQAPGARAKTTTKIQRRPTRKTQWSCSSPKWGQTLEVVLGQSLPEPCWETLLAGTPTRRRQWIKVCRYSWRWLLHYRRWCRHCMPKLQLGTPTSQRTWR